jgi:hypothetical protein
VKVHIVCNQKFTPEMLDLFKNENGVVGGSEFKFIDDEVVSRADYIYLHNDNSMDRAAFYRAANPNCKMVGYADGWRNAHKNVKALKEIGFELNAPSSSLEGAAIVQLHCISGAMPCCAGSISSGLQSAILSSFVSV